MDISKVAFFSASWLIIGVASLSVPSFAADAPAETPAVSHSGAHDMMAHNMMGGQMGGMKCDQMGGMKCDQMGGKMCDHKDGKMCDHKGGMMGGRMGGMQCNHKGGMMGGHGGMMMGSGHMHMIMSLDLNDDQRSKINKLSDELKHNDWATEGLIMDESAKLRDLYAADKRDPAAIGKEYQKIFDLQRKKIEAMITAQNRIEEILTPEQRAKLKDLRRSGGPMHGHPMH